jgi:hypothetical protein
VSLVFLRSIGVSFFNVSAAEYFWLLTFLIRPVLVRILDPPLEVKRLLFGSVRCGHMA